MNSILRFLIIFNLLLCAIYLPIFGQDSTNRNLDAMSADTTEQLQTDSIMKDLRALGLNYLENIHIRDINQVLAGLSAKGEMQIHQKRNTSIDSLAIINKLIQDDLNQLHSIYSSLNNYKTSITASKISLQYILDKYKVTHEISPDLAVQMKLINSKLDSLNATSGTLHDLMAKNQRYLTETTLDVQEEVKAERPVSSLWKSSTQNISREIIINNIKQNYQRNNSFSRYFNDIPWNYRILLLLICIAYAYWCIKTKWAIDKANNLSFSRKWALKVLGKSVIVYITLLPLVSLFTPSFIIQVSQLIIIALYVSLSFNQLNGQQLKLLAGIILFYILIVFANMIVSDGMFLRIVCIVFNIIALAVVSYSKNRIQSKDSAGYINTLVYVLFVVLNVSAIILNVIGKVDVSRSFSIASAVGLMQAFTLRFFTEMIKEDLHRQFEKDNLYKGFWVRFNRERLMKVIVELLKLTCIILAIVVFANNLHFIDTLVQFSENVLEKQRKIGDITFSFANLIVAVLLLLVANWLQKNISLIILGGEDGKVSEAYTQKMTLFPLFRLAIILGGFFFAISALGMNLDKLTVIIGALSVGIGLGMQNIINNFVSGIILVFDKPFRVGDQIELADKKGRVKEIGIRASVLQTFDGANVIIPNGDLLSGRVVNWTLSHEYSKIAFTIIVDRQADLNQVNQWVKEAAESSTYFMKNLGITTQIKDVGADNMHLNVVAWVNYASNAEAFKSDVFLRLYKKFDAENLKFQSL